MKFSHFNACVLWSVLTSACLMQTSPLALPEYSWRSIPFPPTGEQVSWYVAPPHLSPCSGRLYLFPLSVGYRCFYVPLCTYIYVCACACACVSVYLSPNVSLHIIYWPGNISTYIHVFLPISLTHSSPAAPPFAALSPALTFLSH